jgi:hypothetical protein
MIIEAQPLLRAAFERCTEWYYGTRAGHRSGRLFALAPSIYDRRT